ncbi:MAG: peptide transporter [Candidatus Omnitrophota bacterium]|jgi:putative OPT family oligopeptide transporter|nr:MAG: peptide transporter [Candidatus Omnitrophota bacterium]
MPIPPKTGPYREITLAAIISGIVFGILLTACFTYAGLLIGFTTCGSAVAAILGYGVLRGILKKGTIVENNINQTIASGINNTTAGVIFTIPAFYLMNVEFNPISVALAAIAGALLGVLFIIPIRKQMIDLDRLRFPTGVAVATVLKSPGAGVEKSRLLIIGTLVSAIVYFFSQFPIKLWNDMYLFGVDFHLIPGEIDLGYLLGLPAYIDNVWAVSLFSVGAGFITGRPGLVVLAGGVLAYWLITPISVMQEWLPSSLIQNYSTSMGETQFAAGGEISRWAHSNINRPIGIGMLIGGALTGILLSLPSMKAALKSLRRIDLKSGQAEELPLNFLLFGIVVSLIVLFLATFFTTPIGLFRSLIVALVGTLWLGFAGIVVAQSAGMTDWSPISGMALIAIVLILMLTDNSITAAILIGAAVCVAVSECSDMMQDLKTGHLVGAIPLRQQIVQLTFISIGPIVCLTIIAVLWHSFGFGPGKNLSAPQAQALQAAIEGVTGGNVPWPKYLGGAIIGGMLGFTGVAGMGVLVGLSMYLPLQYILPYGLGCLIHMALLKTTSTQWVEEKGVPIAAGLLVGEPLVVVLQSILIITGVILPPGA